MYTINFLPVMVEGKDSGENVVGERHGFGRGLQHHGDKFLNVSNEETIRGSSDALLGEVALNFSGSPPEEDGELEEEEKEHEGEGEKLEGGEEAVHIWYGMVL